MIQYKIITINDGYEWDSEFKDNGIIEFAKVYLPHIYNNLTFTPSLPSAIQCTRLIAYKHLFLLLNEFFFGNKLVNLPQFSHDNGKPYLSNYPNVHFSISHTYNAVAVAVSSTPIGIDIEHYRRIHNPRMLNRVCNNTDLKQFSSDDISYDFLRIWTIKESLVKANGCGIRIGLPNVLINYQSNVAICNCKKYFFKTVNTNNMVSDKSDHQFFCSYSYLYN